jgi:hypothetical protein
MEQMENNDCSLTLDLRHWWWSESDENLQSVISTTSFNENEAPESWESSDNETKSGGQVGGGRAFGVDGSGLSEQWERLLA